MNSIVPGDLTSPEMESEARKELQRLAYERAFSAAKADIASAPELKRELSEVRGELDGLRKAMARPVALEAMLK